jgi:hypothetical protein
VKRLLTSIFAGVIVFGLVAAFAATLNVNAGGLGANSVSVGNCDANDTVDLEYTTAFGAEYELTVLTVSDIDDTNCETISVRVGADVFDNVAITGPTMDFDVTDQSAKNFSGPVHVVVSS